MNRESFPSRASTPRRVASAPALAAAVHLLVLCHRLGRVSRETATPVVCVMETIPPYRVPETPSSHRVAQHPVHAFHAGLLERLTGVAVVILTAWLAIMQISSVVGH